MAKESLEGSPVQPVETRWSSLYRAVVWILGRHSTHRTKLASVLQEVVGSRLGTNHIIALEDYTQIMRPIANAILFLEGETTMYLGLLLPVVRSVIVQYSKLLADDSAVKLLRPLAEGVRGHVKRRFSDILTQDQYKLAAAFHPQQKLKWVVDDDGDVDHAEKDAVQKLMVAAFEKETPTLENVPSPEETSPHDIFNVFSSSPSQPEFTAQEFIVTYLNSRRPGFQVLKEYHALRKLFIAYNTALPSSASCERLFSQGKSVLRPNRSRMSDLNFEMVMFLRGNMKLVQL